jgi:hypothetical protein
MKNSMIRWSAFYTIVAYALAVRLLPYALHRLGVNVDPETMAWPWNFSPALAVCLYGGALLPWRASSLTLPVALYLAGDLGIWGITGRADWAFYPAQGVVYAAVTLCGVCGWMLRGERSWLGVAGCATLASCGFFLATNFACWIGSERYPQTLTGLWICYETAVPFHRNLLVSTLLFSGVLFSPIGVRSRDPQTAQPQTAAA